MMRLLRHIGLCVLLFLPTAALAVDGGTAAPESSSNTTSLAVSSQVDREKIRLGEPFWWTVRVPAEKARNLRWPDRPALGDFVELERRQRRESVDGQEVELFELRLTTYAKLGELELPALELVPVESDGGPAEVQNLLVPPAKVEVVSLLQGVDSPEPRDIHGPVPVFEDDFRLLVLGGLLLLWFGASLLVRRNPLTAQGADRLAVLPPPRKAHEIALERLRAIVAADLLRQGRVQEYFVRLNETLREYLGNRYGFFALDLTSRELLDELRDRITPGLDLELLARLLSDADLVKFARWKPDDQACSTAIDGAHALVKATRLQVEEEGEEGQVQP